MPTLPLRDLTLHYVEQGSPTGAPVLLIHPEGLSHAIWDAVVPLLPQTCRIIAPDLRGHGRSACPAPPYAMGALIRDAEALMEALKLRDAVVVGLGLGGLVAQGLAVKRLDLVRGLVLSNTAARIPATAAWQAQRLGVTDHGMDSVAEPLIDRWFPRALRESPAADIARSLLHATDPAGFAGCVAAMDGTDFYTTTATLTLPALLIAGAEDAATPPDLVRETAALIRGADFALMRGAGHLPCLQMPQDHALLIAGFLRRIGH